MGSSKFISIEILDKLNEEDFNRIVKEPITIICKNFSTEESRISKLNLLSAKNPRFWKSKNKWHYYIKPSDIDQFIGESQKEFNGFTDNFLELVSMSNKERLNLLTVTKDKLIELKANKEALDEEVGEVVSEASTDSIMLNKVIFDDLKNLTPEKAKEVSKAAVNETSEIVQIATNMLSDFTGDFSIFSNIIEKSNGSTVQHMTRTFLMTLAFFQHYNYLLNRGYASKIRVNFGRLYREKYSKLLPKVEYEKITLEKVFKGGMKIIPAEETNAIGVGFLLHDIGKQVDLEYFEGSEGYIKERIQAHVTNGFNELLKRTVYPPVVSAIAGFHHEYYGDSSGYGPLRDFIKNRFPEGIQPEHCISYTLHEAYRGEALCFFPAKMLEIVDVFDALTDPGRKYRDPLKPEEAVEFMRDVFLKDHIKIDPILFDIFISYLKSAGELKK